MNKTFLILFFLFSAQVFYAQEEISYTWPVRIPVYLSSSYGELRSGHFHSGIDIKTDGKTGQAIIAIEDGYVSRIKISPYGYGKAIYIDHPTGHTSVYGHLEEMNQTIAAYVKKIQYESRSFGFDHYPEANALPVKKGELIAYSGNSGRSGGPHLHFEIRDTKSEIPLNPFRFYKYTDTTPPVIKSFSIYSRPSGNIRHFSLNESRKPIIVGNKFGIGIETIDLINGSNNKCGIYQIEAFIDSILFFSATIDSISFFDTHFIKSHMDYKSFINDKVKIHKLFIESNNELNIYKHHINNGFINIKDTNIHNIKCIVYDFHFNKTTLDFQVQKQEIQEEFALICDTMLPFNKAYFKKDSAYLIDILPYTLVDTVCFSVNSTKKELSNIKSEIYKFGEYSIPALQDFTIYIKHDSIPEGYEKFLLLGSISKKGKISNTSSIYSNGYVGTNTDKFGSYAVFIDTIPPKIKALNVSDGKNMNGTDRIKLQITDNLSGIDNYYCYIDGKWVLFEYEPKNAQITYIIDNQIKKNNKEHNLFIEVYDERGNKSVYSTKFVY